MSSSSSSGSLSFSSKKREAGKSYRHNPYHLSGETSESLSGCFDFLDGLWSESKSGSSIQSRRGVSTTGDDGHVHSKEPPSVCSSSSTPEIRYFTVNSLASFTDIDRSSRTPSISPRDFMVSKTSAEACEVGPSEHPLFTSNTMLSAPTPQELSCTHEDCVPVPFPRERRDSLLFRPGTPVVIGFKYGVAVMVASFHLAKGSYVIVPGDREYDCGKVLSESTTYQSTLLGSLPEVIRAATQEDLQDVYQRDVEEQITLARIRKIAEEINFPATVLDVMYQIRFTKVTIIIQRRAKLFVDFRRLQRAAYNICHCRVWVAYLDEVNETMRTDTTYCKPEYSSSSSPMPSSFSPFFSMREDAPQSAVPKNNFSFQQLPQPSY